MAFWWNGRHSGLKIRRLYSCKGSTPLGAIAADIAAKVNAGFARFARA